MASSWLSYLSPFCLAVAKSKILAPVCFGVFHQDQHDILGSALGHPIQHSLAWVTSLHSIICFTATCNSDVFTFTSSSLAVWFNFTPCHPLLLIELYLQLVSGPHFQNSHIVTLQQWSFIFAVSHLCFFQQAATFISAHLHLTNRLHLVF